MLDMVCGGLDLSMPLLCNFWFLLDCRASGFVGNGNLAGWR